MKWKRLLHDIRFWIVFFAILRLYGITNPPLEIAHNWRQTTVTMVARNFFEGEPNMLYPRIDIAGEKSGITGMEFPILNYLIYVVSILFGYQHWYGRLINLIITSFGIWYFYRLVRRYFDEKVAFYSTWLLLISIWFQFSRKIMPDTFSMSFLIAAIYYGSRYFEISDKKHDFTNLALYGILMVVGILSKLPSGYIMVIFLFWLVQPEIQMHRKLIFCGITIVGMIPIGLWYFYWVPHLVATYGFWHFFMGKDIFQGVVEIYSNLPQTLSRFYETALQFIGFGIFLYGMVLSIIRKQRWIYLLFTVTFASFCIVIFKAGFTFPHHSYYIIPFVPVMALVAGYGMSNIRNQTVITLLLTAVAIEGIANQKGDFFIKENQQQIERLEKDADGVSSRSDLILINSDMNPTPMYFAHRKGWVASNQMIQNQNYIDSLKSKGLKNIVILKRSFGTELQLDRYPKILDNLDYTIYRVP